MMLRVAASRSGFAGIRAIFIRCRGRRTMSRAKRPVMLVGGVPGNSAEEVFGVVAPIIGDLAVGLTDGEFGVRRFWVFYVAVNTWDKHPDVELIRPNPQPMPGFPEWLPPDYHACPWWGPKA